jgi:hypothetical protein
MKLTTNRLSARIMRNDISDPDYLFQQVHDAEHPDQLTPRHHRQLPSPGTDEIQRRRGNESSG